jgi:hypothetical protein
MEKAQREEGTVITEPETGDVVTSQGVLKAPEA